MALPSIRVLSLCSGAGGLDLGVRIANSRIRTICFVEWSAYAAAALVARTEAQDLDQALVWDNLRTFDGTAWRGSVDCIVAGFPCQPFSTAGKGLAEADERNLWPEVARVVGETAPQWVFIENVSNILPYYYAEIRPTLRELGYSLAEGLFTAAEVGAPHKRERLFALAYARCQPEQLRRRGVRLKHSSGGASLEQSSGQRLQGAEPERQSDGQHPCHSDAGVAMANAQTTVGREPNTKRWSSGRNVAQQTSGDRMANTLGLAVPEAQAVGANGARRTIVAEPSRDEGNVHVSGPLRRQRIGTSINEVASWPPGPKDERGWAAYLKRWPSLAPSLPEPKFRSRTDELAYRLARLNQLHVLGNGVVPLQAAFAFICLAFEHRQAATMMGESTNDIDDLLSDWPGLL